MVDEDEVVGGGLPSCHADRDREAGRLDIEVSHALGVGLDESFARQNFIAH